mmetsp:Transcript_16194/g.22770  ORF Transcript_16194/g.22770 Transcript_16194/m.22770 type:complete len:216 (+) Transcript_16194:28-675(+)
MSFFQKLLVYPKKHPFIFQVVIATTKTSAADYLVQKHLEGKKEIDWRRNMLFTAFGFTYLGCWQWIQYVHMFRRMFPGMEAFANAPFKEKLKYKNGPRLVLGQVAFDNFVVPCYFFPLYYTMKESIQGTADVPRSASEVFNTAMTKFQKNWLEDFKALWKVWIVGDIVIFSCPLWMRLPLNHGLSFVYVCILSYMRGAPETLSVETTKPSEPENV